MEFNCRSLKVMEKWNFRRLSGYELAGNEIFLRHGSSGDWGSWVEWSAIKRIGLSCGKAF